MKTIITFAVVLISFININAQHIFPLHVGDKWIYWEYPSYFSEYKIDKDTTMTNGKLYYNLQGNLYRQQGDSVFIYDPNLNDEYLTFDFSANEGDTITKFEYKLDDTLEVILTYKYENGEYLGIKGTYYTFFVNQTQLVDDEISLSVFDSLGIIGHNSTWVDENLSGAVINGKIYGNITGVKDKKGIPKRFILNQNYPNPFNPSTSISYSIDNNSIVNLDIYNILGEKVTNIVNEYQTAGDYKVNFNAKELPSGIYFYKLKSNNHVLVKKMILLK